MLLFLKIVLAVVLVLVVGAVLAFWAFKRWLRRKVGDVAGAFSVIDPRYNQPARLQLQRAPIELDELESAFRAGWEQLHALGFRPLADFAAREDSPEALRAAVLSDTPIAAALGQWGDAVHLTLFAFAEDQRLEALGDGPGESLHEGTLHWEVVPGIDAAAALERLRAAVAGRALRPIDAPLFRQLFERAYARRQDALLLSPPRREALEARAAAQPKPLAPAQVERAWQIERAQWQDRLREALLDHYRQTSRIDAERWERIGSDLQVVHARLEPEEIRDMLVEEPAEIALWQQLVEQGHRGIALYEALAERLPVARQRQRVGELRHPLPARIYGRLDDGESTAPATAHLYEAVDDDGRTVRGAVLARSSAEAKQQLGAQGLGNARITAESMPMGELPEFMFDPEIAELAAKASRDTLPMALLRSLRGNWLLWLPPLAWTAWSLREGAPYDWGDWLGFGYLALAMIAMLLFVAPMILYNQLMHARLQARWGTATLCLALLRRVNLLGGMRADQLALEEAKILAGAGKADAARALWEKQAPALDEAQRQSGWIQLHDVLGDLPAMIVAQRALIAAAPSDTAQVDLAIALLREGRHIDEAEDLLAAIDPQGLSELAAAGYQFARGLLADHRDQHAQALRHYAGALEQANQFRNVPLVLGLLAEINGFSALALKRSGDHERADDVWRSVRPLLMKHASGQQIVAAYEGALVG